MRARAAIVRNSRRPPIAVPGAMLVGDLMLTPHEDAAPHETEGRTRWVRTGPRIPRVRLDWGRTAERWHGLLVKVHYVWSQARPAGVRRAGDGAGGGP